MGRMTPEVADSTAERILDVAQRLVQSRGFNGFSYADIAEEVGIRKASIHHHFPGKEDLGRRLMERYQEAFLPLLARIEQDGVDAGRRLRGYVRIYADVLRNDDRMCLCGMLAADFHTLPRSVRDAVRAFFDANEDWLGRVLQAGRKARRLRFGGSAAAQARFLLSGLEGAMLVSRPYADLARFQEAADRLLATLGVRPGRR